MTKKELFKSSLHTIAYLNDILDVFDKIGLIIEDKAFNGSLYASFNEPLNIAMNCLSFNSVSIENELYNKLLNVKLDDYQDVIEEVWQLYGNREDI